jgi:hypothetical protein
MLKRKGLTGGKSCSCKLRSIELQLVEFKRVISFPNAKPGDEITE